MNPWLEGWPRFLLNVALAAATVSLASWVLARIMRKAATEWRLLVVQIGLLAVLASPLLALGAERLGLGSIVVGQRSTLNPPRAQSAPAPQKAQSLSMATPSLDPDKELPRPQTLGAATSNTTPAQPLPLPYWVAGIWALVSAVLLGRLAVRSLALRAWLRRHAALREGHTYTANIPAPFCGGIFRPFLVLPQDFDQIPEDEQRAVLEHERAHLRLAHPLQQFLAEVACATFGWLPFVVALRAEMKDLHERQGDESVLRVQQDGLSLAQGLVRFAERLADGHVPASALSIVRPGSSLEGRIQRLIDTRGIPMQPKKQLIAIAGGVLGLASLGIACTLQVASARPATDASRYLPFQEGTTWLYDVKQADEKPHQKRVTAWSLKDAKPYPVMEFREDVEGYRRFDYWTATPGGIRPVDNVYLGDMPGFNTRVTRSPQLPNPVRAGYAWNWTEEFRGQTMSLPGQSPKLPPPSHHYAKIVAIDKPVTVPAGTFRTVVVEERTEDDRVTYTNRRYWAQDVGIVKREIMDVNGNITQVEDLREFKRGEPVLSQSADQTPIIQQEIGRHPALAKLGKALNVEILTNSELQQGFRSRFAVVTWKNRVAMFRIYDGRATLFDPRSPADWNTLRADENLTDSDLPGPAGLAEMPVGNTIALLVAANKGYSMTGAASRGSATQGNGGGGQTVTNAFANGTQANGEPWSVTVQFKSNRGKVTEIRA